MNLTDWIVAFAKSQAFPRENAHPSNKTAFVATHVQLTDQRTPQNSGFFSI